MFVFLDEVKKKVYLVSVVVLIVIGRSVLVVKSLWVVGYWWECWKFMCLVKWDNLVWFVVGVFSVKIMLCIFDLELVLMKWNLDIYFYYCGLMVFFFVLYLL